MDSQIPKCTKIAVRAEFADGSSVDLEAPGPDDVTVEVRYPEPRYDLGDPVVLRSRQPPPTITLRFTANWEHGYTEKHNVPLSSIADDPAEWRARMEASLATIAARLDEMPPRRA